MRYNLHNRYICNTMIQLKQIDGTQIYNEGDHFNLSNSILFKTTKALYGYDSWYYEATCYSGNGFALFGFWTEYGSVNFYPMGNFSSPCVSLFDNLRTENLPGQQQNILIPFSVTPPYTVGIGIDTNSNTFTVFYNNSFFTVEFNQSVKIKNPHAYIWGAHTQSNSTNEEVSANFGGDHLIILFQV